jgi:hypothetical protein
MSHKPRFGEVELAISNSMPGVCAAPPARMEGKSSPMCNSASYRVPYAPHLAVQKQSQRADC